MDVILPKILVFWTRSFIMAQQDPYILVLYQKFQFVSQFMKEPKNLKKKIAVESLDNLEFIIIGIKLLNDVTVIFFKTEYTFFGIVITTEKASF